MLTCEDIKETYTKKEYNEEPIFYCAQCLSLAIRALDEDTDFCDHCGNTIIGKTDIEFWEKKYKERYGVSFINKK